MAAEIRMLAAGDHALFENVAPDVFDDPVDPRLIGEFLADRRHHIAVAIDDGRVVGFASGVHYVHPDKPAELWINEVGVASSHHRQGLGKAVVETLLNHGKMLGCREAWVLTERANAAAMALYSSAGGKIAATDSVMFTFPLDGRPASSIDADPTVLLQQYGEAFNRHDLDALMAMMTGDCSFDASAGDSVNGERHRGPAAVRAAFADVFAQFPDAQWRDARHFVAGDRGVSEWTFTGTRADGSRVEVRGCDIFTLRDGKIAVKDSFRKNRPPQR